MNASILLRSASLLALASCALAASAQTTAYTSLAAGPPLYALGSSFLSASPFAARFVATQTGALAAFLGAVNNSPAGAPVAYTLTLHADGPGQTLGDALASYSGLSTGLTSGQGSALSAVATPGGPTLLAGTAYWASLTTSSGNAVWTASRTTQGRTLFGSYIPSDSFFPAFSVQVTPVPEPSALAVLGVPALALLRRRRRA